MAASRPSPVARPAGPAPGRDGLHEAALRHLARFAATRAGLLRVLDRRIDRWVRRAEAEGGDAPDGTVAAAALAARARAVAVVDELVAQGLVDDAVFAEARARRLSRGGRSARAIGASLARAGVAAALAGAAVDDGPEAELLRALLAARRKRIGPFARDPAGPEGDAARAARHRALGQLARAGFAQDVAQRVLAMASEEAEERVLAARRT